MVSKSAMTRMLSIAVKVLFLTTGGLTYAASLSITDVPLFLSGNVAPLNMLVVGRDHKLFYEAYADHSDLDGDGTLDIGYRGFETKVDPDDSTKTVFKIDYYGYFDSYTCYSSDKTLFVPVSQNTTKKCDGSQWSGDWLNWVTTTRIDALRKVLYGGKRSTDTATQTILERATIPEDAHSWGKEYTSATVDGYNIADVAPLTEPTAGTKHFFANTTLLLSDSWTTNTEPPLMRVLTNQPSPRRIWHWVSKEAPVAGGTMDTGSGNFAVTPTDYIVRVQVCRSSTVFEDNCRDYPTGTVKKPTGLLQDFGENDSMLFGLLSGSYQKSKSGGVVRKDVGSIKDEINWDTDGTFKDYSSNSFYGIIKTMDRLRTAGFTSYRPGEAGGKGAVYDGGLVSHRAFNDGEHGGNWGNPVAEMMYEALRYFAQDPAVGSTKLPTSVFDTTGGIDGTAPLSLNRVGTWSNPYGTGKPVCAKPFETVLSDVNTSYDSDQLPGSNYGGITTDLPGSPNVKSIGATIWNNEIGSSGKYFIGDSNGVADGAPTPKVVSSFGTIRGQSPEEPTKEGSYYAASIAHYGLTTDLNTVSGKQNAQTFAVALASPLPRIEIPVNGRTVTIIPFGKSVGGCGSSGGDFSTFQPTNQIVDFYIEDISADRKKGTFQVNFEDVEAGNDHDMDAIARYSYEVQSDNTIKITVSSDYAAGCIIQHLGYVISGTEHDGIYLVVRDLDTGTGSDPDYFLDTPPAFDNTTTNPPAPGTGTGTWKDNTYLPTSSVRTFKPGATDAADVLQDPLWYAAKWGGFKDSNGNNRPDLQSEWDEDKDGVPDNYYLVTNALTLNERLSSAFLEIGRRQGSSSSASVNTGSISSETRVYQAKFSSGDWTGQLLSFPVITVDDTSTTTINEIGTLAPAEWSAWEQMNSQAYDKRVIITNATGTATPFLWASLDTTRQAALQPSESGVNKKGALRVDYLRGDERKEQRNGGTFRNRESLDPSPSAVTGAMLPNKLGDIVSSSPIFVGPPPFAYSDTLESKKYSLFVTANANRPKMVYVGANDGMLHGFDAGNGTTKGQEKLAFIPSAVFGNLVELTKPNYPFNHKFFVDGTPTMGDAFYNNDWHTVLVGGLNKGGKSIYALDITDPSGFTEANAANIFRWEYKDVDLGFTYSRPAIAKMANGTWVAIFGNGYNASGTGATGHAYLYVVNLETGAKLAKIDTVVGDTTTPNGLATPAVVDINGDSIVDFVYAGDLKGNLWKFDMRDVDPTKWNIPYTVSGNPVPLFTAKDTQATPVVQPITSKPEVGRGPKGQGMVVLFGTGKFMEANDKAPTQTQTFYGLLDPNTNTSTDLIASRANLTQQSIIYEGDQTFGSVTVPIRVTTQNAVTNRGWYLNLLSPNTPNFRGEMQVSNSALRAGRIIFTTLIPDSDPCGFGGTSWLMEMDSLSGARLVDPPFDFNNDGLFTSADQITIKIGGVDTVVSPSGRQSEVGITQGPGILFDPGNGSTGGKEYKYLSGSTASTTTGSNLQRVVENPGPNSTGRQSWRQLK
ncbi:MAG: PilC/PilY family type IV pilus protein [Pseudomonadota bacterium]